ncbi:MAG TPA: hypothetical protein PLX69_06555 [Leptospiraceae bacterium]|nr:hypothetical protein [Leptospiraceae bacterium]HRG74198.1 hypothetical protein [Leptospiraceae bacterium]
MLKRLYITYTKRNQETEEVYSGRASGETDTSSFVDSLRKILAKRDSSHHKNKEGYEKAELDKFSFDGDAIRGREQMLIEHFGGAKSDEGTSGNARNSISPRNNNEEKYRKAAIKIFGIISFLVAIIYLYGQS